MDDCSYDLLVEIESLTFKSRYSFDEIANREGCHHHRGFERLEHPSMLDSIFRQYRIPRLHTLFEVNYPFLFQMKLNTGVLLACVSMLVRN